MILHLIMVHDTGVVVAWGICPVRTCLVAVGQGHVRVQSTMGHILVG